VPQHRVGVRAREREREPPAESSQEAAGVAADEVAHDSAVESGNTDAEDGAEDEEYGVKEDDEGFFGGEGGEGDVEDGAELAKEDAVDVGFVGRRNSREQLCLGGEFNLSLFLDLNLFSFRRYVKWLDTLMHTCLLTLAVLPRNGTNSVLLPSAFGSYSTDGFDDFEAPFPVLFDFDEPFFVATFRKRARRSRAAIESLSDDFLSLARARSAGSCAFKSILKVDILLNSNLGIFLSLHVWHCDGGKRNKSKLWWVRSS
jgi:hypothetical protein